MTDLTKLPPNELTFYCGDDGMRWADAFCQMAKKLGYGDLDQGWVFGWFANAIEQSTHVRNRPKPSPQIIKDFPGRAVEEHYRRTGKLPSELGEADACAHDWFYPMPAYRYCMKCGLDNWLNWRWFPWAKWTSKRNWL